MVRCRARIPLAPGHATRCGTFHGVNDVHGVAFLAYVTHDAHTIHAFALDGVMLHPVAIFNNDRRLRSLAPGHEQKRHESKRRRREIKNYFSESHIFAYSVLASKHGHGLSLKSRCP
jgi:hypothetical protein